MENTSMNISTFKHLRQSLVTKLIFSLGLVLFCSSLTWMVMTLHLRKTPAEIPVAFAAFILLAGLALIIIFVVEFVRKPIYRLIDDLQRSRDESASVIYHFDHNYEVGKLAGAIYKMRGELTEKQAALNKQRDEYQTLFERVPCLITVQDRNYKLLKYNHEFAESFAPSPGDYCYKAYKGRDRKCNDCPVEKTFEDGLSHYSEETGFDKEGNTTHWLLKTSPIRDDAGDIVAAMEMSLDITHIKILEELLEKSEKKYHEIFHSIPNPVFVLDAETVEILNCNDSVKSVYGYAKDELKASSFLDLFKEKEKKAYKSQLNTRTTIHQVSHLGKNKKQIVVNIKIAESEYLGQNALLVTTSDITQRLETEQQLIQASKMATLGEMATGVAHELNQPLSVIKTGSSFCMKKFNHNESIKEDTIKNILSKIDSNADRATNIIQHMRQIARKSDQSLEPIQINDVLKSASEIFSQQLRIRNIDIVWNIMEKLPLIWGDWGRLEQVIINLVINARDAIEERWGQVGATQGDRKISLITRAETDRVILEVCDTGAGVPAGLTDKIFEPFFTTKEVGKGTGLGLSISYGFVKECKGDIKVMPNDAGGTCFVLTFPKAGKTEQPTTPPKAD